VRLYQCGFHWRDFQVILLLETGMKIFPDNPTLDEIGQKYGAVYMKT
jgi:hypothetical protein